MKKYNSRQEILDTARAAVGKTFGELDKTGRINIGKGAPGSVVEESVFGYQINSNAKADFEEFQLELKVLGFRRGKKGEIRAKERLVCNIIDYMKEHELAFEESSFWKKSQNMLLMTYEYLQNVEKKDFILDEAAIFSFPKDDLEIIKQDREKIIAKIKAGKAHEISEGDTLYLGACTKGKDSSSVRKQPFSDIMAKQRAYSLKQSYMTFVLSQYIYSNETLEHIIKDASQLADRSFEEIITEKVSAYIGYTQKELKDMFGVVSTAKNLNELLLAKMLGINGKITASAEFQKANIATKTIRLNAKNKIAESMSFSNFDFCKLVSEEWEESEVKEYFESKKFMFILFKENKNGEYVFDRIKFWNMPLEDLAELERVWKETKKRINDGLNLELVNGRLTNNLPKSNESTVAHVRPHAKKSAYKFDDVEHGDIVHDAKQLPDGRWLTKQCFWLNSKYVEKQVL
ncbi:MAG: Sau3AI family type II restriction endonuclease [Bacillota bacterium]